MVTLDQSRNSAIDEMLADWVFRTSIPGAAVVLVDAVGYLILALAVLR